MGRAEVLMAEPVTLQLSGQQAALLAPILLQICGADKNQGDVTQGTPQHSLAGSSVSTPSSSESTLNSSSASPLGVIGDCVFSLDDLLNPKKRGSQAQNYGNVSLLHE